MTILVNSLACAFTLACATLLWKPNSRFNRNALQLALIFLLFCLFSYFGMDYSAGENNACDMELYPFRMMAICLCFSTTSLRKHRRLFLVLAQTLWFWIEFFGGISLYYRGYDVAWTRVASIACMAFCSTFLSKISREMEFCLMVFWIAVWMFF